MSDQQDGAGRLRRRFGAMLDFIGQTKGGRATPEVEKFMLLDFGIVPKTTQRYLEYGVRFGKLQWTNRAHSRVKVIEV